MSKPWTNNRRHEKSPEMNPNLKPLKGSPHVRVNVTEEMIATAIRKDAFRCWITRAIQTQHPKYTHVTVDLQTVRFSDPERSVRYIYLTPRVVQACLVLFDQGKKTRPFNFELRGAHTVSMKRINRQKGVSVSKRLTQQKVHNLGRKRVLSQSGTVNGVVDTIGGRAAPRHVKSSGFRRFGLRAFTSEDLEDMSACNPAFQADKLVAR